MVTILYRESVALIFFTFREKRQNVIHKSGQKLYMKLVVNTLEKSYMPLYIKYFFFYSDLNDFSGFFHQYPVLKCNHVWYGSTLLSFCNLTFIFISIWFKWTKFSNSADWVKNIQIFKGPWNQPWFNSVRMWIICSVWVV